MNFLLLIGFFILNNPEDGVVQAIRLKADQPAITIDGNLEDLSWQNHPAKQRRNFEQTKPNYGQLSRNQTEYAVLYDDKAIYLALRMYDEDPTTIPRQVTPRDDMGSNTDVIAILIDPYQKGQTGYSFFVTAAGVQLDLLFVRGREENIGWNSVWQSAVQVDSLGWTAEIRIPYSAIRFPSTPVQDWGFIVYREQKRYNEESFNKKIDPTQNELLLQLGRLTGLQDLKPPLRLELYPYASIGRTVEGEESLNSWNFGTDLRYGINQSFTLDMTLVPDFSHVKSDEEVLNLSVFDVRYQENRPFFTEGTELFNRADLFYSRRIGEPFVGNEPTPILNAFKITGRSGAGTGLGFLNAVTRPTDSGDPWMNYNLLSFEQTFGQQHVFRAVNTNVWRGEGMRKANVTLASVNLLDKTQTYSLEVMGITSGIFNEGSQDNYGHRFNLEAEKVRGKFNAGYEINIATDDYNISDFGFQQAPNYLNQELSFGLQYPEGNSFFQRTWTRFNIETSSRLQPYTHSSIQLWLGGGGVTRKNWELRGFFWMEPFGELDFYDARSKDYIVDHPSFLMSGFTVGTDTRKKINLRLDYRFGRAPEWDQSVIRSNAQFRFRANDRLSGNYSIQFDLNENQRGGFSGNRINQLVLLGRRNVSTLTHRASLQFTPDVKQNISLDLYRTRSKVDYEQFYVLNIDRSMIETPLTPGKDPARDFKYLAFDVNYQYQLAPGSFLKISGKTLREMEPTSATINGSLIWYFSAK
jgi:hypothetical protein